MWHNRTAFRQTYPERADGVFARGEAPGCVVVYVDAWTAYGGSQFVDSPGTGRYHTYLCDEVVPFVDARYRTLSGPAHRGVQGKSSGGFGAMITPMLRPDLFGGLATHAGDSLYELCYIPEFGKAARALREYDGSIEKWWEDFNGREPLTKPADHLLVMLLGVSACFSAEPDGAPVLPFEPSTGRLREDVWRGGWPGTRCGWSPGTPPPCGACGRPGWTPGPRTSGSWTWGRWRSATPSPGSGLPTSSSPSTTPPTAASTTGTRCHWPTWRADCPAEQTFRSAPGRPIKAWDPQRKDRGRGHGDGD
jgi:hypothetical protein